MSFKIGSLFDGSGGFPLAATICGITPTWASEIEPYPIAVTRARFPNMAHLGDISKINGAEVEPVDVITFGSPCQDLSVAGKRAGLKHEANGDDETTRSGLFMEAVRIIKEMRRATNGIYPRFALWENVPGAFSSNRGEDFRIVLDELIRIVEPDAVMPPVPKAGWAYADSYRGDGWSLAYRVFDAQYWGVPQRRRRIHLVADFRGECAEEILFKREGVRGYFAEGGTQRKAVTPDVERCLDADDREGAVCYEISTYTPVADEVKTGAFCPEQSAKTRGIGWEEEISPTLRAGAVPGVVSLEPGVAAREGGHIYEGVSGTLRANMGDNQMSVAYSVIEALTGNVSSTLGVNCNQSTGRSGVIEKTIVIDSIGGQAERGWETSVSPTLKATHYKCAPSIVLADKVDPYTLKIRSGCEGGGKGALVQKDKSAALATNNDQYQFQPVSYDARGNGDGRTVNTITGDHENRITDYTSVICAPIPVHDMATRFAGKRGDKADGKGNGLGVGAPGDPMNTLTAGDRHAVAYCIGNGQVAQLRLNDMAGMLNCMHDQQAIMVCDKDLSYGVDCRNGNETPELYPTLQAKPNGGQSLNFSGAVRVRYLVRRLTPTECARLQGFPDLWGHFPERDSLTDEEYAFWLEVRNTHAAINGKQTKDYSREQILSWYNKLHTDSAEYKMWGNGIALPPALYVMQGIYDALVDDLL